MVDDDLRLLVEALSQSMGVDDAGSHHAARILMDETLKFRDKLLEDTGRTLTVADARLALDALEARLHGQPDPDELDDVQKALTQILVDSLTLFKR